MEKVYNQLKNLSEPQYEHAQRFAKSYTDKVRTISTSFHVFIHTRIEDVSNCQSSHFYFVFRVYQQHFFVFLINHYRRVRDQLHHLWPV
jgi:hypothetical protein